MAVLAHVNTTETSATIQSSFPHGNERMVQQESRRSLEHICLTFPQHPKCKIFPNSGNRVQFLPGLPTAGLHSQVSSYIQFHPLLYYSLSPFSSHEIERASRAARGIFSTPQSRRQWGQLHPSTAPQVTTGQGMGYGYCGEHSLSTGVGHTFTKYF